MNVRHITRGQQCCAVLLYLLISGVSGILIYLWMQFEAQLITLHAAGIGAAVALAVFFTLHHYMRCCIKR